MEREGGGRVERRRGVTHLRPVALRTPAKQLDKNTPSRANVINLRSVSHCVRVCVCVRACVRVACCAGVVCCVKNM